MKVPSRSDLALRAGTRTLGQAKDRRLLPCLSHGGRRPGNPGGPRRRTELYRMAATSSPAVGPGAVCAPGRSWFSGASAGTESFGAALRGRHRKAGGMPMARAVKEATVAELT